MTATPLDVWAGNLVSQIDGALRGLSGKVDASIRGLSWKQSARAASTGNVTRSAPGADLDGVALTSGDRVLLKDQTITSENGIYVWTGGGVHLARSSDADSSDELAGAAVTVTAGAVNGGSVWVQTTGAPILGSTPIMWTPVGAGATVTVSDYMPSGL